MVAYVVITPSVMNFVNISKCFESSSCLCSSFKFMTPVPLPYFSVLKLSRYKTNFYHHLLTFATFFFLLPTLMCQFYVSFISNVLQTVLENINIHRHLQEFIILSWLFVCLGDPVFTF